MSILKVKNNETWEEMPSLSTPEINIIDNLTSADAVAALSANQGRILNKAIEDLKTEIFNSIYPIGSIYLAMHNTNPTNLFGGEWEQIEGRYLMACGSTTDANNDTRFYDLGATGGEFSHTLTTSEMPAHQHGAVSTSGSDQGLALYPFQMITTQYSTVDSNVIRPAGGGQSHNNMPPYIAIYVWKRIG